MNTSNTLPIAWTKIIQLMMFIEFYHEGIISFFMFELLIFGGKERFFGLGARLESLF
jgi:hypothetical protein